MRIPLPDEEPPRKPPAVPANLIDEMQARANAGTLQAGDKIDRTDGRIRATAEFAGENTTVSIHVEMKDAEGNVINTLTREGMRAAFLLLPADPSEGDAACSDPECTNQHFAVTAMLNPSSFREAAVTMVTLLDEQNLLKGALAHLAFQKIMDRALNPNDGAAEA